MGSDWKPIIVNTKKTIEVLTDMFNSTEKAKFYNYDSDTEWVEHHDITFRARYGIDEIRNPFSEHINIIEIPTEFIRMYTIRELRHLLFHYIAHLCFRFHTPVWKKFMRKSGYDDTFVCNEYKKFPKYVFCCSNENCKCNDKRMVNEIKDGWTCKKCGSKWDYFLNKA